MRLQVSDRTALHKATSVMPGNENTPLPNSHTNIVEAWTSNAIHSGRLFWDQMGQGPNCCLACHLGPPLTSFSSFGYFWVAQDPIFWSTSVAKIYWILLVEIRFVQHLRYSRSKVLLHHIYVGFVLFLGNSSNYSSHSLKCLLARLSK